MDHKEELSTEILAAVIETADTGDVIVFDRKCSAMRDPIGVFLCGCAKMTSRWDHNGLVYRDRGHRVAPSEDDGQPARPSASPFVEELLLKSNASRAGSEDDRQLKVSTLVSPSGRYIVESNVGGVTMRSIESRLRRSKSNEVVLRRLEGEPVEAFRSKMMVGSLPDEEPTAFDQFLGDFVGKAYKGFILDFVAQIAYPPDKQERVRAAREIGLLVADMDTLRAALDEDKQLCTRLKADVAFSEPSKRRQRVRKMTRAALERAMHERRERVDLLRTLHFGSASSGHTGPTAGSESDNVRSWLQPRFWLDGMNEAALEGHGVFCSELCATGWQRLRLLLPYPAASTYSPYDFMPDRSDEWVPLQSQTTLGAPMTLKGPGMVPPPPEPLKPHSFLESEESATGGEPASPNTLWDTSLSGLVAFAAETLAVNNAGSVTAAANLLSHTDAEHASAISQGTAIRTEKDKWDVVCRILNVTRERGIQIAQRNGANISQTTVPQFATEESGWGDSLYTGDEDEGPEDVIHSTTLLTRQFSFYDELERLLGRVRDPAARDASVSLQWANGVAVHDAGATMLGEGARRRLRQASQTASSSLELRADLQWQRVRHELSELPLWIATAGLSCALTSLLLWRWQLREWAHSLSSLATAELRKTAAPRRSPVIKLLHRAQPPFSQGSTWPLGICYGVRAVVASAIHAAFVAGYLYRETGSASLSPIPFLDSAVRFMADPAHPYVALVVVGGGFGMLTSLLTYPLEVLGTLHLVSRAVSLMTNNDHPDSTRSPFSKEGAKPPFQTLVKRYHKTFGWRGWFHGARRHMLAAVPYVGMAGYWLTMGELVTPLVLWDSDVTTVIRSRFASDGSTSDDPPFVVPDQEGTVCPESSGDDSTSTVSTNESIARGKLLLQVAGVVGISALVHSGLTYPAESTRRYDLFLRGTEQMHALWKDFTPLPKIQSPTTTWNDRVFRRGAFAGFTRYACRLPAAMTMSFVGAHVIVDGYKRLM